MQIYTILLSILAFLLLAGNALGFNDDTVHPIINESAVDQSIVDEFLRTELGFSQGLDATLSKVKIYDHLGLNEIGIFPIVENLRIINFFEEGGKEEDELPRPLRHFHNPLQPWSMAGFSLILDGGRPDSSLIWAQMYNFGISNKQTWFHARDSFYKALTTGSDDSYAETFKILGQLMHLVSDNAVPAHVRDDGHFRVTPPFSYFYTHFELYTKEAAASGQLDLSGSSFKPGMQLFNQYVHDDKAPAPISALWDINKYTGNNPETTLEEVIGLAEYTNANFLSEGTIFNELMPHPDLADTNYENIDWKHPEIIDAEDGLPDFRVYIYKYLDDAKIIRSHRLAAVSYFTLDCWGESLYEFTPLVLDDIVYKEYADKLVPRAVGYSTALLDYFFRGRLEISPPDQYVYAIIDGGDVDPATNTQYIHQLKAKVRNITPGEEILGGSLVAVAKYKKVIGYQPDLSSGSPTAEMREGYFSFSTSAPIPISSLSSTTAEEFSFDFSNNPIPAGITDLYLQVVFQGTLGNENDQSIAVGMRDINEPQHITIWNYTDYFQLDFAPVTAEEVRLDRPIIEYFAYISPHPFTEKFGFSRFFPEVDVQPIAEITDLPPARYSRLIVLTDQADSEYFLTDQIIIDWPPNEYGVDPSLDETLNYSLPTIMHQEDYDGTWHSSSVSSVRDIVQHYVLYFIQAYPSLYFINNLPAPAENIDGPFPVTIDVAE